MSGVVGLISNEPVNQVIYDALLLLQHRGQNSAGIATVEGLGSAWSGRAAPFVRRLYAAGLKKARLVFVLNDEIFSELKGVGIDQLNGNDRVYNIVGQQCSDIPQKGLYILKGRKYVAN